MSYENPDRRTYVFQEFDFGGSAGTRTEKIVGPKGKKGRLIDYGVQSVQETFAGTTPASIAIGINGGNVDEFGEELSLGTAVTTAAGGYTVRSLYDPIADATNFDALMVDPNIPADTVVAVTCVEAITGPAGKASAYVVIDWDN